MNKPLKYLKVNSGLLLGFGVASLLLGFLVVMGFRTSTMDLSALGMLLLCAGGVLVFLGAIASFIADHAAAIIFSSEDDSKSA